MKGKMSTSKNYLLAYVYTNYIKKSLTNIKQKLIRCNKYM